MEKWCQSCSKIHFPYEHRVFTPQFKNESPKNKCMYDGNGNYKSEQAYNVGNKLSLNCTRSSKLNETIWHIWQKSNIIWFYFDTNLTWPIIFNNIWQTAKHYVCHLFFWKKNRFSICSQSQPQLQLGWIGCFFNVTPPTKQHSTHPSRGN